MFELLEKHRWESPNPRSHRKWFRFPSFLSVAVFFPVLLFPILVLVVLVLQHDQNEIPPSLRSLTKEAVCGRRAGVLGRELSDQTPARSPQSAGSRKERITYLSAVRFVLTFF